MACHLKSTEDNLSFIANSINRIDKTSFNNPSWQKLKTKLRHIQFQEEAIQIDLYNHYAPLASSKIPKSLQEEIYQRSLKTTSKMQTLLADYQADLSNKLLS